MVKEVFGINPHNTPRLEWEHAFSRYLAQLLARGGWLESQAQVSRATAQAIDRWEKDDREKWRVTAPTEAATEIYAVWEQEISCYDEAGVPRSEL